MSWKHHCYLIILLLVSESLQKVEIEDVIKALKRNLKYINGNYGRINVDCLFGIVFGGAILEDTISKSQHNKSELLNLQGDFKGIHDKSLPLMVNHPNWYFAKHILVPTLWLKPLNFEDLHKSLGHPSEKTVRSLFDPRTYTNFSESLSDFCLSSLVRETGSLCTVDRNCSDFVNDLGGGSGYMLTHRLLFLQVARARHCELEPRALKQAIEVICDRIYEEVISVEYFRGLDEVFDLFLEQSLLCGYEGFANFLKPHWLHYILTSQHPSGCFPSSVKRTFNKREIHEFDDGCADHTTGLGAASLSLYLNYLIKQN